MTEGGFLVFMGILLLLVVIVVVIAVVSSVAGAAAASFVDVVIDDVFHWALSDECGCTFVFSPF